MIVYKIKHIEPEIRCVFRTYKIIYNSTNILMSGWRMPDSNLYPKALIPPPPPNTASHTDFSAVSSVSIFFSYIRELDWNVSFLLKHSHGT
jgi:hypothetical protein